jgi:radical SAM superfamily enzyme
MLPQLNKRFACAEVRTISDAFAVAGIKRDGFLLLGGPGETRKTVEESLEYADSLHLDGLKITVGLRIYPQTPLASTAVADGLIGLDEDLLLPRFYITPSLRDWLPERIRRRESCHG